jgi:hypothetical protein
MLNKIKYEKTNAPSKFIIVSAFTKSHEHLASRLENSIDKFNLNRVSFEIPEIHRSISPKGCLNSIYTKPNVILRSLELYNKPVVYIDSDCIVEKYPYLFDFLCDEEYDFALFNWLACQDNSAYTPQNPKILNEYSFSHSIDYNSQSELICSGAVQYWGQSNYSFSLLKFWQLIIQGNQLCPDDHSLDFSYNNYQFKDSMKIYWLPKSYVRYGWWIFDNPTINHPDIPYSGEDFKALDFFNEKPRVKFNGLIPKLLTETTISQRKSKHTVSPNKYDK